MRKPIIAGNWKMHKTVSETERFIKEVTGFLPPNESVDAVICAPAILLHPLIEWTKGTNLKIGAQNMHWEEKGAFTGEISPYQLSDLGVEYVIIGHSERRQLFAETDDTVNKKVQAAYRFNLKPIVCVGETLVEKEAGKTDEIVRREVEKAFEGLDEKEAARAMIAYEPIWAIGTGKHALPEDANAVCETIRTVIRERFSEQAADMIRIQYGGSVHPDNITAILSQPHIDGALVGGASLESASFLQLLEAVCDV